MSSIEWCCACGAEAEAQALDSLERAVNETFRWQLGFAPTITHHTPRAATTNDDDGLQSVGGALGFGAMINDVVWRLFSTPLPPNK